ncbi:MAG: ABC transporter substrate-binding protein [Burkholderiales bacterium]
MMIRTRAGSESTAAPGHSATGAHATARTYRMAYLGSGSDAGSAHLQRDLFARLRELGYAEGENLLVERRFADGEFKRLPGLAAELVGLKPDVLFVTGTQGAVAASRETRDIPVVFASVSYPVGMGLVRSLKDPGTNLTGLANQSDVLSRKRLELLKEVFPAATRVAVIHNPQNAVEALMLAAMDEASARLKLALPLVRVNTEQDYAPAFRMLHSERPDVLYVIESPLNFMHRARIVESVSGQRLPAVYGLAEFADAGGLMSYSYSLSEHVRAAAGFVDRILKGAKPADLPVEQPTRFELVINLKTARAQDVKFPRAVLARADRVIE